MPPEHWGVSRCPCLVSIQQVGATVERCQERKRALECGFLENRSPKPVRSLDGDAVGNSNTIFLKHLARGTVPAEKKHRSPQGRGCHCSGYLGTKWKGGRLGGCLMDEVLQEQHLMVKH